MRRRLQALAACLASLLALLGGLALPAPLQAQPDLMQPDLVRRGAYLTRAADCQACHTAAGGVAFAGGRAFTLPIGVLYAPNITPDPDTGIGGYTDAEWLRMMHVGIGRGGKHLYPAMPYNSYTQITDEDALAIKAYLFSLKPVRAAIPANRIRFPFNHRILLMGWNLVNNPNARFQPDPAKAPVWNRGAYLVEALGHCAQCHSPRTLTQGLSADDAYAGALQQGWLAYNLTSDPLHGLGKWSDTALEQYLATGQAEGHGPASGPMAEAVQYSLRTLTPEDIHAMAVYLRDLPGQMDGPEAVGEVPEHPPAADAPAPDRLGGRIFTQACAGCHLPSGAGRQSAWAALRGAHSTGDPAGTNLVQVLTEGSQIETAQGLMFMHPFTGSYTDGELAAVANYTIAQFGGRQGQVTPKQIARARANAGTGHAGSGS